MLVLIFLPALAIASHQEFQLPMHWLPYPSPDYLRQVIPYRDEANRRDVNIFTKPLATQPLPDLGGDPQGRLNNKWKLKHALDAGYLFGQLKQYQQQYHNPHQKTVTLVITTTVNITSSQRCIPASQFADYGFSMSIVCRSRRKRGALLLDSWSVSDEDPISIQPSQPQQVVMTTFPGDVNQQLERGNRHLLLYDPDLLIASSKDDVIVMGDGEDYPKREKRFYYLVATTTVVSFLVNTFTTQKKISLASASNLICRPSELPVCLY